MITLVALALAGQLTPQDVCFARIVEAWVVAQTGRPSVGSLPPDVRALGAPSWRTREAAQQELAAHKARRLRDLVRAERVRDPEIALRARLALDTVFICPRTHLDNDPEHCPRCGHTGDVRYRVMWGPDAAGHWDYQRVERDLFAPEELILAFPPEPPS